MIDPCLPTVCDLVATKDVSSNGRGIRPQVNMFEQVSSDDNQISVAEEGGMSMGWDGLEGLMSRWGVYVKVRMCTGGAPPIMWPSLWCMSFYLTPLFHK